jgi:tyrosine-protein kinase Etk/Wzc
MRCRIFHFLQVIAKRRLLVAGVTATAIVTAATASMFLPDTYTAKAKILPPQQQSGLLSAAMMQGLAAIGGDMIGESKTAKLYVEMLKVESLRDPVIEKYALARVYDKKYRDDVYKTMNKKVLITAGKEGIITISVDDSDPKRAAGIANALVDELKRLTTRMSMTGANNSKTFFDQRLTDAKADLSRAENELKDYQKKYKAVDATQQAALSVSATAQLTAELTSQEMQLSVLRRSYADTSQTVKNMMQSIAALKEKIARLQGSGESAALPGLSQLPDRGQEYLQIMRRYKTAESVYDMLVKQYEVAKVNADNDVSTIQVLQQALVPERKSKPARSLIVIVTAFVALLFSVPLAFLVEMFSTLPEEEKALWRALCRCRMSRKEA